jgi:UDP-N-acetylmuramyl pentapeptide phosphotransferase/UDP-N-acetylglucosamine-1-phosphate transferase
MVFVATSALSAALIRVLWPLFTRYVMAKPNARSSHRVPTPQGGGIAVVAAVLVAASATIVAVPALRDHAGAWWPVTAAVLLLAVVGWMDDVRALPVVPRLISHVAAAGLVVLVIPDDLRVVPLMPLWVDRSVLLFTGVYLINIVNFMDGLDWMTVAEFVPVCAGVVLVSVLADQSPLSAVIAVALGAAVVGFAPFNRPVAKLFLGDVGSLPLGILLFWLLLDVVARGHLAAAILLPLYYLMDATVTLLRRLAKGEMIFQAHRSHFYQRATDNGFSVGAIVGRVFAVNLGLVLLAAWSVTMSSSTGRIGAVVVGAAVVVGLLGHFSRVRH